MRDETVARNYAETLFELATRNDALQQYGDAIETVAKLIDEDAKFRLFMETPRIDDAAKKAVIRKAFAEVMPKHVVNFVKHHDEVSGGASEHLSQTEKHFTEGESTVRMPGVELMQNSLSDSHAR